MWSERDNSDENNTLYRTTYKNYTMVWLESQIMFCYICYVDIDIIHVAKLFIIHKMDIIY